MATEPRNNDIGNDTDDGRQARLALLSENIDTYAVELGIAGPVLTWAQDASAAWEAVRATATVEDGEWSNWLLVPVV